MVLDFSPFENCILNALKEFVCLWKSDRQVHIKFEHHSYLCRLLLFFLFLFFENIIWQRLCIIAGIQTIHSLFFPSSKRDISLFT